MADTLVDTPFSYRVRAESLERLTTEPVDLLVIGAGITGAGIARDAAMRGVHTALVDKADFASATSSSSSRLIHGGLRYLEHRHLRLVFEASRERRILLRIAPHLVWPRSFIFPIHTGCRVKRWQLFAGLWLYDLLAAFRNVQRHEILGKRGVLRAEPQLRGRGLKGGARYYDAQCDDARLTLANVRDAHRHGATVANYARVERLDTADGTVGGAWVTDLVTGREHLVRAHVVVNATGPWTDEIGGTPGARSTLHPTKGAHVLVPSWRIGNREAVTLISPIDGRVLFVIPWRDFTYIGTTETEVEESPDDVRTTAEDVVYLLRTVNAFFPEARLTPDDVQATWAGLRPLVRLRDDEDPNAVSREHVITRHGNGLVTIAGGKLTTYRKMAAEVVDTVVAQLHDMDGRPVPGPAPTDTEPLPGGETRDLDILIRTTEEDGFARAIAEHLVYSHGAETSAVLRLVHEDPELGNQVCSPHPTIWAQLVFAMRREMAVTLGDLLMRRTRLFHEAPRHALDVAEQVATLAGTEMQWDPDRTSAELAAYTAEVERNEAFRSELDPHLKGWD